MEEKKKILHMEKIAADCLAGFDLLDSMVRLIFSFKVESCFQN